MIKSSVNLAIIAPVEKVYSETFIEAHRKLLQGNIFFYFGVGSRMRLDGSRGLCSPLSRFFAKVQRKFLRQSPVWFYDQLFYLSLKENNVEVVLAEYGPTAMRYLPIIKRLKLPLIVHFHGYDASESKVIRQNDNYKDIFEYATSIVAVSQKMWKDLKNLGCPVHKLTYNVYGPNKDFFNVIPKFSKPQFISIGRFVDKKAPYYTILAFKEVLDSNPEAKLIMAGTGPLLNTCINLVRFLGIESAVIFPGIITPQNYQKFLTESVAMVQHSIMAENGDSEGTPVGILEASAAGLPVISTFHAGIPDVIEHNEQGLLVEEHNVNKMASYMKLLLTNVDLAKELGSNGRKNVKENFSLTQHITKLDGIISNALLLQQ